ncbi:MAG: FtsX-like permease family protein [Bacteroidales bacterium]
MKTLVKLAWRNLWRNKRRTLITIASIFFGVFFASFMTSLQKGSFENMVENMVKFHSGYIQIQNEKFMNNRSLNNSFEESQDLDTILINHQSITHYTSRIESFALASTGEKSYGAMVFGVIPEEEEKISELSKWVKQGTYLSSGSNGVLIGKELAENLELNLNDTLVLIGQGYHGVTAAAMFPVIGILDFPLPALNKQTVYMSIENARQFYSMPNLSSSKVIMVKNADAVNKTISSIKKEIKKNLKVYSWNEMQEELESLIEGKQASGKIIKGLLFMIIGFGIWGTIIMLMAERKRELGIMIALGVKKIRVVWILLFESFMIGILGVLAGIAGSLPLIQFLFLNPIQVSGEVKKTYEQMGFEPILKFSNQLENFTDPAISVFALFSLISIYPIWFVYRLKTANALRA